MNVSNQIDELRERINKEDADSSVQKFISLMASLKVNYLIFSFSKLMYNEGDLTSSCSKLNIICCLVQDLERKENHFMLNRDSKHSELQAEISELERKIANDCDSKNLIDDLHHCLSESLEKVDLMKKVKEF